MIFPYILDPVYGCWIWQGRIDNKGYGRTDKGQVAHRVVFSALANPIPDGLELDHRCRRKACVRPTHLEPVSGRVNKRRMPWRARTNQERCPAGHDLYRRGKRTPEGGYVCLECDDRQDR